MFTEFNQIDVEKFDKDLELFKPCRSVYYELNRLVNFNKKFTLFQMRMVDLPDENIIKIFFNLDKIGIERKILFMKIILKNYEKSCAGDNKLENFYMQNTIPELVNYFPDKIENSKLINKIINHIKNYYSDVKSVDEKEMITDFQKFIFSLADDDRFNNYSYKRCVNLILDIEQRSDFDNHKPIKFSAYDDDYFFECNTLKDDDKITKEKEFIKKKFNNGTFSLSDVTNTNYPLTAVHLFSISNRIKDEYKIGLIYKCFSAILKYLKYQRQGLLNLKENIEYYSDNPCQIEYKDRFPQGNNILSLSNELGSKLLNTGKTIYNEKNSILTAYYYVSEYNSVNDYEIKKLRKFLLNKYKEVLIKERISLMAKKLSRQENVRKYNYYPTISFWSVCYEIVKDTVFIIRKMEDEKILKDFFNDISKFILNYSKE